MRRLVSLTVVGVVALTGCTFERRTDRTAEEPPEPSLSEFLRPWGESSPPAGVKSGDLVWIWFMGGTVPGSVPPRLVEGGIGAETGQALANIAAVLEAAGAETRDVAQCSVFLADGGDLAAMREAYLDYFPAPPARVAVQVGDLALGARVEIECTAVLPSAP
jgi:enamine deaminase RidA (YjgF/YER057c/UK114 family)